MSPPAKKHENRDIEEPNAPRKSWYMIIKSTLDLSTSMDTYEIGWTLNRECLTIAVAHRQVGDFAKINTFGLFFDTFTNWCDSCEIMRHSLFRVPPDLDALIPISTRNINIFSTRPLLRGANGDFRFWLFSEYWRLAGGDTYILRTKHQIWGLLEVPNTLRMMGITF